MQHHKLAFAILLATGGAIILNPHVAHAALSVCKSGCDYTDIQDAVTDAPDGEVIRIRQGVFTGPISIENKNLTLKGDGSSLTIIDRGPPVDSHAPPTINISCTSSHKIIISNVTISGGTPFQHFEGGGGLVNENCDVTLTNTLITNNTRRGGGGIGNNGKMVVKNSVISGNAAELGGGGIDNQGELSIIDSFIVGNSTTTPGKGGGIVNDGTLEVKSSTITENHGPDGGGFANAVGGIARLIDTIIINNTSFGEGGGLWNVSNLELKRSLVIGNTAETQSGGGIYQKAGGNLKMTDSTLINNSTATTGGGLYAEGTVTANIKTIIQGNTPDNCAGGVFLCP